MKVTDNKKLLSQLQKKSESTPVKKKQSTLTQLYFLLGTKDLNVPVTAPKRSATSTSGLETIGSVEDTSYLQHSVRSGLRITPNLNCCYTTKRIEMVSKL